MGLTPEKYAVLQAKASEDPLLADAVSEIEHLRTDVNTYCILYSVESELRTEIKNLREKNEKLVTGNGKLHDELVMYREEVSYLKGHSYAYQTAYPTYGGVMNHLPTKPAVTVVDWAEISKSPTALVATAMNIAGTMTMSEIRDAEQLAEAMKHKPSRAQQRLMQTASNAMNNAAFYDPWWDMPVKNSK
jgi:uncharacterized membrane protein YgaE (UPF0421/DUF939 family)